MLAERQQYESCNAALRKPTKVRSAPEAAIMLIAVKVRFVRFAAVRHDRCQCRLWPDVRG
jgi:hypothetical protein